MTQSKHQNPSGVSEEEAHAIQAMREQGMPEWEVRLTHFERQFQREKKLHSLQNPVKQSHVIFSKLRFLRGFQI